MKKGLIIGGSDSVVARLALPVSSAQPTYIANWEGAPSCVKGLFDGTNEVVIINPTTSERHEVNFCRVFNGDTSPVMVAVYIASGTSRYSLGKWFVAPDSYVDIFDAHSCSDGEHDLLTSFLAEEIVINGATTGTISHMHVCNGVVSDYNVELPVASGCKGKIIGFRMSSSLTKLVTLLPQGADLIDGASSRVMWANESAILYSDGSNWSKLAGKSIPMSSTLGFNYPQTWAAGTSTQVNMNTSVNNHSPAGFQVATEAKYKILRPGRYRIAASILSNAVNATPNGIFIYIHKNGTQVGIASANIPALNTFGTIFNGEFDLVSGDSMQMYVNYGSGAYPTSVLFNDGQTGRFNFFEISEQVSW